MPRRRNPCRRPKRGSRRTVRSGSSARSSATCSPAWSGSRASRAPRTATRPGCSACTWRLISAAAASGARCSAHLVAAAEREAGAGAARADRHELERRRRGSSTRARAFARSASSRVRSASATLTSTRTTWCDFCHRRSSTACDPRQSRRTIENCSIWKQLPIIDDDVSRCQPTSARSTTSSVRSRAAAPTGGGHIAVPVTCTVWPLCT